MLATAVLALTACAGHHATAVSSCTLSPGPDISERTGEHSLALRTSCALRATPRIDLDGIPFTYVPEGGPKGAHVLVLDKYRCDIRAVRIAHQVTVDGTRLAAGPTLMDWCPGEGVSTVVHVYLGGIHARATWHGVLRDAYDGRLDRVWTCGALRAALAHLPVDGPMYSVLPQVLGRAAARACDGALGGIAKGAPRAAVDETLGAPSFGGPRCVAWRWPPASGSVDGGRVCFEHGRATHVQTAVHL